MGDADAFAALKIMVLAAEGDDAMSVLKPDRARGLSARRVKARELVEEDATVRVSSAFWHEFKAMLGLRHYLCGIMIPHTSTSR